MSNETIKRIHFIYGILLSVLTVIAAICIMVSCVNLYQTDSYSREAVAESFSKIAIPVYLCLVLVIGGFILDLVLPFPKGKKTVGKQTAMQLKRLHAKIDLTKCDADLAASILKEQKKRKLHFILCFVLLAVGVILFLPYGLNGNNFHQSNINSSMIQAVLLMAACLILPFAYAIFASFYAKASMERELTLVKQVKTFGEASETASAAKCNSAIFIVRCAIVVIGIGLLLYGLFTGGVADVLTKAINICTECIGLG